MSYGGIDDKSENHRRCNPPRFYDALRDGVGAARLEDGAMGGLGEVNGHLRKCHLHIHHRGCSCCLRLVNPLQLRRLRLRRRLLFFRFSYSIYAEQFSIPPPGASPDSSSRTI